MNTSENKLRTYALFKKNFELENYIISLKIFQKRQIFSKLRVSAHDLHIETGRYKKPKKTPVNQRICTFCDTNEIEDEFHVILKCTRYENFRKDMLNNLKSFADISNMDEKSLFVWVMNYNEGDSTVAKIVTDYVWKLFDERNSLNE